MRLSRSDRLSDPDAHVKLKQLYKELCPEGMTQERFGEVSGIGTQGMVWQFLNGHTPLTLEAAVRFANTLGCTLYDISPMLDAAVRSNILPVLGMRKRLRRAAVLSLFAALPLVPSPSDAAPFFALKNGAVCIMSNWVRRVKQWLSTPENCPV
jgi:transcriptional regulator with XRE-family HTH domain